MKSTITVMLLTMLSRIFGLLREVAFATFFGAGSGMDAFLVAFKIPNFLRRLFAEGAFAQSFVPVLAEYKETKSPKALIELIQKTFGALALIVFIVGTIGSLTSALWIAVFAPGFWHEPAKFDLASHLLRITFPYIFFISLTALSGSVLNTFNKFSVPAFTPVLLNLSFIAAAILFRHRFEHPVTVLAYAVLAAGIIQFCFQLPFLYKLGVLRWPVVTFKDPGVRKILKLMIPALFGASVAQISLLFDTIFASFLKTGSISWLYYSDRLMQFPLGVFGVALSTVVLPHLAKCTAKKNEQDYKTALAWALKWVFYIGVPASVGLIILSRPLLITFFNYGEFNFHDVLMSQESLITFSLGVVFFMAVKVLVSAFYSRQDMKTPVKIALIAVICNIILNAILMIPLKHAGLALATSLSALINASLLAFVLYKRKLIMIRLRVLFEFLKISLSTIAMCGSLHWLIQKTPNWMGTSLVWRLEHLLGYVLCGAITYAIVMVIFSLKNDQNAC